MQSLKVELIQTVQYWEDIAKNLQHFEAKLGQVKDADLILLPEMFSTSFTMKTELAEKWETSTTKQWLIQQAQRTAAAIYTSFIVEDSGQFYNRGVFVEPSGKIHHYDKRKCFSLAREDEYFTAGSGSTIVDYKGWKIQLQICYDLRFPEILRNTWNQETQSPAYDLMLFVANWPAKRSLHWTTLLRARAIENQCFVLGLNRVGLDGNNFAYAGQSAIISVLGTYLIAPTEDDNNLSTTLDFNQLTEERRMLPFLKDQ